MVNIVIGAVNATKNLIETMLKLKMDVSMVFSLDEKVAGNVSAYYPLHEYAQRHKIPFKKYRRINDDENIELMRSIEPDYIFAIGFSQLVSEDILNIPRIAVIGCHPADLPHYRGRAVVVWQMLNNVRHSKITMFKIDAGADSGDIIAQEPFEIFPDEYVGELLERIDEAQIKLYEKTLPKLMNGTAVFTKQNEAEATYALRRVLEDGEIAWTDKTEEILKLIRAVSHPYPGAYGMYDGKHKIIIWKAHAAENTRYIGIPGQIAEIDGSELKVLTKEHLLVITEYENLDNVKMYVGHKLR